jgi:hypothetical protein
MLGIREEKGEPFASDRGASGGKKHGLFSRTGVKCALTVGKCGYIANL